MLGRSWQEVLSSDAISHLDAWAFGSRGHSWEEFQEIPWAFGSRGFDPVNWYPVWHDTSTIHCGT
jgi:hypothetical protein